MECYHDVNIRPSQMHISFPSEICSSEAYIGGIGTDIHLPPFFDSFNELRCTIPHLKVNDSQLGSDVLIAFDWKFSYFRGLQSFV